MVRIILPVFLLLLSVASHAAPVTIGFTAMIGDRNNIDTDDVFGEGVAADLSGQTIVGSFTIDPSALTQVCSFSGACYLDYGAGAISAAFTLNGITASVISTGTLGFAGNTSGGMVSIKDPANGGSNYLSVGAASADGAIQETIGVLFGGTTGFSAFGGGDPLAAIGSLGTIGGGQGLVAGGITFMSATEHLDATIITIEVPEPPGMWLVGLGLLALEIARRRLAR